MNYIKILCELILDIILKKSLYFLKINDFFKIMLYNYIGDENGNSKKSFLFKKGIKWNRNY